ncbi:acyl-CoA carboxylase subunit epsilon [Pseudarthrobacter sp. P1]|uniref:acyl-CoA carboxylase subunit epsilon n=1 Tax=Pseudarthrobacter sp. P1 TaxID=3418418 RepID=UPI003CEEB20E
MVSTSSAAGAPLLTVTKGNPTPEELAALTAVVLSLQVAAEEAPATPATRAWVRRAQLNLGPKPGPGAWRRGRI